MQLPYLILMRPIPDGIGHISQWFGERPEVYGKLGTPGHPGLDYGGLTETTPILASHNGVVELRPFDARGYGNYVIVHGMNFYTLYAHLSKIAVSDGDQVFPWQVLGYAGNTGNSTGLHLHWAIRSVDPNDLSGWQGWLNPKAFRPD